MTRSPRVAQNTSRMGPRLAPRGGTGRSLALAVLVSAALPATAPAADAPTSHIGDALCSSRAAACATGPVVAIFSAFPTELAPFLKAATITETFTIAGRRVDVGTLAGTRVVLTRTGIGMVNASAAAKLVVERFAPVAMVFSGVAGSYLNIADVAVPLTWIESPPGTSYPSDPGLLDVARRVEASPPAYMQCGIVPPTPPNQMLCLPNAPKLVVGGTGRTSDPYGGKALACTAGGDPIFGCTPEPLADEPLAAEDMETASVAHVAHDAGIPFIGFRGVSDGAGDPLNLGGFPRQFFAYYELAADNAAAATMAFLAARGAADVVRTPTADANPTIGAACDWPHAASAKCTAATPTARLTDAITAVCTVLSHLPDAKPAAQKKLNRQARARWLHSAQLARSAKNGLPKSCRNDVVKALRARAKAQKS